MNGCRLRVKCDIYGADGWYTDVYTLSEEETARAIDLAKLTRRAGESDVDALAACAVDIATTYPRTGPYHAQRIGVEWIR